MHRVELKVSRETRESIPSPLFLMHRVELKVGNMSFPKCQASLVPNAPCGVESMLRRWQKEPFLQFLMHRVELKVP